MATKSTKSVGKLIHGQTEAYWLNAAKQIEWPVDIAESHISVPEADLERAQQHLMVQHFCNAGFFIQTAIDVPKKSVFDPHIVHKLPAVQIAPDDAIYKVGDRFRVKSTDCELEIVVTESKKINCRYLNRNKPNIITSEEMLTKNLSWGLWIRI